MKCRNNTESKNPKVVKTKNGNSIVNRLLLAGDKFMSEMHLRQPGFTYSSGGPLPKNKERIKRI